MSPVLSAPGGSMWRMTWSRQQRHKAGRILTADQRRTAALVGSRQVAEPIRDSCGGRRCGLCDDCTYGMTELLADSRPVSEILAERGA